MGRMRQASNPTQVHHAATLVAQHSDSLATRFRQVFPADDDGWTQFSLYNGLASAISGDSPGLAAVYRATGTALLFGADDPYRPSVYRTVATISELSAELARTRKPERKARLLEKLEAARIDLIVAL